jgi:hypothetical protein
MNFPDPIALISALTALFVAITRLVWLLKRNP